MFSAPDQAPGFSPPNLEPWSSYVSRILDTKAAEDGVRFYNPAHLSSTLQPALVDIGWPVFPERLRACSDEVRWAEADKSFERRDSQDEYCEWSVKRNHEGKITKAIFTCEFPEYWDHIAKTPQYLLQLYQQFNPGCDVRMEDLYLHGRYNPRNKWNTGTESGGIAHMLHPNNMLDDAVELAAKASIIKRDDENKPITDGPELVRLAGYQSWRRSSDPHVAQEINKLAREGQMVTLANPIGVYFEPFFGRGKFRTAEKAEIPWFWTFSRGKDSRFSRVVFEVPPEAGYVLGDIYDVRTGRKIMYGAQLADHLRIKIIGQATPFLPQKFSPLWSFIIGRSNKHEPLTTGFISSEITDWFGRCLASNPASRHPLTLRAVIDKLPAFTWVPFIVHEGLHIPDGGKVKGPRIVVICTPCNPTPKPQRTAPGCKIADINILRHQAFQTDTLCIVGSASLDGPDKFLQCAGFDPAKGWFNFYERSLSHVDGTSQPGWLFFGSSKDAFSPLTRGKGVFCGHVNGALMMKELERPWLHWHSSMSPDLIQCLNRENTLLKEEIMQQVGLADDLEIIILEGLRKWYDKRLNLDFGLPRGRQAVNVKSWVAHALLTTTVNIGASTIDSKSVLERENEFWTPKGLFYNEDCLSLVLDSLGAKTPNMAPISASLYKRSVEKLRLCILENIKDNKISSYDEGQCPWAIPTPSREDLEGVRRIVEAGLLPKQNIAALLMVDFCNPIYSSRRAALMKYVPDTSICIARGVYDLADRIFENINNSPQKDIPNSPEAEYLQYLNVGGDLNAYCTRKVVSYLKKVNARLQTQEGVDDYMKLSESRRRTFRPPPGSMDTKDGLAEFDMTLPYANAIAPDAKRVVMTEKGEINEVERLDGEVGKCLRPEQSRFSSAGCPWAASR